MRDRAVVRLTLLATLGAALLSCSRDPVGFQVTFATTELRRRAVVVSVSIERGACSDPVDESQSAFVHEGAPTAEIRAPGDLGAGTFSFRASARDRECRVFARGCREVRLPMSDPVPIEILMGHVSTEATCPTEQRCVAGRCEAVDLPRWVCPSTWRASVIDDPTLGRVSTCEPFPRGAVVCDGASAQLPGDAACTAIGRSCDAVDDDGWPDDSPAEATFVRAGETGGDGSRARPFGDLVDAIAATPDGGTVVASGTFTLDGRDEDGDGSADVPLGVTIERGIALRGVCPGGTVLDLGRPVDSETPALGEISCTAPCESGAVLLRRGATLGDVTVRDGGPAIWARDDSAMDGVVVSDAVGYGVLVDIGVDLDVTRGGGLAVRGTLPVGMGEPGAVGGSGHVRIRRLVVEDNATPSLRLIGMELDLSRAQIHGSIVATQGSRATIDELLLDGFGSASRIRETGEQAIAVDSSSVLIRDAVIHTSTATAVQVEDASSGFELRGGRIEGRLEARSESGQAAISLRDAIVVPSRPEPVLLDLDGAEVVTLERTLLVGASECAVRAPRAEPIAWRGGAVVRSTVALCVDEGTAALDRCNVRTFETVRAVRGERGATPTEACNGCDDDGNGDASERDATCAAREDGERGQCADVATEEERRSDLTRWRCCLDPIGVRPCEGVYGVEVEVTASDGSTTEQCCTW